MLIERDLLGRRLGGSKFRRGYAAGDKRQKSRAADMALAPRCGASATTIEHTPLSPKRVRGAGLKAGFLSLQLCSKGATLVKPIDDRPMSNEE
jgi:hypothetical protein